MANRKQLDRLKQSMQVWNQWRRDYPGIRSALYGARLVGVDLAGADLSGANLSGVKLTKMRR